MLKEKIINIFKNRKFQIILLVILALTVGFWQSLDNFILLKNANSDWGETLVIPADVHKHVMWPQAREVVDGYLFPADPWIYEHRIGPPFAPWPWIPPLIYAPFFLIFGAAGQLPWSVMIISAVVFLILFKIIYEFTGRRCLAAIFSILLFSSRLMPVFLFSSSLIELKRLLAFFVPGLFSIELPRMDFMIYESINPGFLIFGPILFFTIRALKTDRLKLFYLIGALSGLLIYTYPFFWMFQTVFLGCLFLLKAAQRQWLWVKYAAIASAINIFIAVPYAINELWLNSLGLLKEITVRNAAYELGHNFRISQWQWYLTWTIIAYIIYKLSKRFQQKGIVDYIALSFASLFVCLNMQVITGFNMAPDHWIDRISYLPLGFTLFFLFRCLLDWLDAKKYARKCFVIIFLSILTAGAVLGGVLYQISSAAERRGTILLTRSAWSAVGWIRDNASPDSVVLSPSIIINTYVPIFTSSRVFLPHAINTLAKESEVFHRRYLVYALYGIKPEYFLQQLHAPFNEFPNAPMNFSVIEQLFLSKYTSTKFDGYLMGFEPAPIPEEDIKLIIDEYSKYKLDLASELEKYKIDYIVSDEYSDRIGNTDLKKLPYLELVFKKGAAAIYKLDSSKIKKPI